MPLNKRMTYISSPLYKDSTDGMMDDYINSNKSNSPWGWKVKDPTRNLLIFIMYYLTTFGLITVLVGFSLYNLTHVPDANKEYWVGLLSMLIGIILPSPSTLNKKTIIKNVTSEDTQPLPREKAKLHTPHAE